MLPLAVDLRGNGSQLTGLEDHVRFGPAGEGRPAMGWAAGQGYDAFLVLDGSGDRLINSGLHRV
jgi:hypothetical protein